LRLGEAEVVAAGGAESMSNVPFLLTKYREGYGQGDSEVEDAMYRDGFLCPMAKKVMGATAETLAERHKITRAEQDAFAVDSQAKAERAKKENRFAAELVSVGGEPVV